MAFVTLCTIAEQPAPGQMREISVGRRQLCLANDDGQLAAVDNLCPHRGGPLAEGTLEGGKILCPWHAWAFDLTTGAVEHGGSDRVRVYQLRVEGNEVQVEVDPVQEG